MDLLYLLSLLPGGISPDDLDYLWGKYSQENRKHQLEVKHGDNANNISALHNNSYHSKAAGSR